MGKSLSDPHRFRALVILLIVLASTPTHAKTQRDFKYPLNAIWSTLIRFLRVDRGYEVTDRDKENGFLTFTYPGTGAIKKCPGAIELFTRSEKSAVTIKVAISHQPSYVEHHLLDGLELKLREERGVPVEREGPPADKPKKKPSR